jgi:hypothetical protein
MKESMPLNYVLFKCISILVMVESLFKFVVKGGLAGAVAATTAPANPDKVGRVQDLKIKYTRKWPVAPLVFVVVYFLRTSVCLLCGMRTGCQPRSGRIISSSSSSGVAGMAAAATVAISKGVLFGQSEPTATSRPSTGSLL